MRYNLKFVIYVLSTIFIMSCNNKTDESHIQTDSLVENKNLEIKMIDYEHLVFDKSIEIKHLNKKLKVLNEFITNFYFGEISTDRNSLLKFYRNKKKLTVFEKGNDIVVGNILFVYQYNVLNSIEIVD